jgi:hypothetical protein
MMMIIGSTPPPIGGVTIYVKRLIENLTKNNQDFYFLKLTLKNLILSIYRMKRCSVVHLVASHPFVRLYYSILCKILRKKLIVTYTDNIGEFSNSFYNLINSFSIRLTYVPTVLNNDSYKTAKKLNSKTRLISSFIPPCIDDNNMDALKEYFGGFLFEHKYIFCTNAYSYCIDKSGNELYGIISLISIFNTIPDLGLIISDPSGAYNDYVYRNNIKIGSNIRILSANKFSFVDIIKLSHCSIRATTTDGDSLSIKETIYLNKDVICSDCVSRPSQCLLYTTNDYSSLYNKVLNYKPSIIDTEQSTIQDGFIQIFQIYKELLICGN